MKQHEIIALLKQWQQETDTLIRDFENTQKTEFFTAALKQKAIELYELLGKTRSGEETRSVGISQIRKASLLQHPAEELTQDIITPAETPEIQESKPEEIIPIKSPPADEPAIIPQSENHTPPPAFTPTAGSGDIPHRGDTPPVKTAAPPEEKKTTPAPEPVLPEEISLNERISKNKQPVLNFADKSKETPVKDIAKAISISKKFEFINGLFNGNADAYKNTLNALQGAASYEAASQFLESDIMGLYKWEENEKLAAEFYDLLRRRFTL